MNGEPIQRREFVAFLNQHRGDTTLPLPTLKEKALQELIHVKVTQIEGKKRGFIPSTRYSDFLVDLEKENERRMDAIANKQVIYGPRQYNEQTYYAEIVNNLSHRLKDDLAEHHFDMSDVKLREFYEATKDIYASNMDNIMLREIIETTNNRESLDRMQLIMNRIQNGESFDRIYEERMTEGTSIKEESVNENNARDYAKYRDAFYRAAMKLNVGEVSEIIADRGGYVLIKCVERGKSGYKEFKEVSPELKLAYIDSQYDQYVSQLEKQADVKLKALYDQISLQTE
ncbi:peptidyl-prolyl cis-trans isomerase [Paenibacillus sp. HWE-109]|uniref:peptidylprolyl isomerase n=1 Tax=Paenibacillus sp. HWE-109 TaxID=1306526 RepID=UPI001EE01C4A|nr:peptidyl-prolyl cis-trans isomerase [Paenibacillus sp. HWE-109]UKS24096.1 peptidyl-prolyl cis-trans isomerase [Paenibacillus sp. HWE-109]